MATSSVMACLLAPLSAQGYSSVSAPFTGATTVVSGLPACPILGAAPGVGNAVGGPAGALDDGKYLFVTDVCHRTVYRFTEAGGRADEAVHEDNGLNGDLIKDGSHYYGIAFPDTGSGSPGQPIAGGSGLYEFNPTTLAVLGGGRKALVPLPNSDGMAVDPQTGDLFIADQQDGIVRVSGLPSHPSVSTFAPANGDVYTNLAFNADGTILYATNRINFPDIPIVGFNRGGAQIFSQVDSAQGEGLAVAAPGAVVGGLNVSGDVFVDNNGTNDPGPSSDGSITRIEVNAGNTQSIVANGGTRGDAAAVSCAGAMLVTQGDSVVRMSPSFFGAPRAFSGCQSDVAPAPHGTRLGLHRVSRTGRSARFTFKASGVVQSYQCALTRPKKKSAAFTSCRSPKTYSKLAAGKYTFEVRAVNSVGRDKQPARLRFTI